MPLPERRPKPRVRFRLLRPIPYCYIVRRFIVKSRGDADYSIRYQINLATLNAALNGNPQELDGLNAFVDNLVKDTLRQVCAVTITGYSSPDGPLKFNEALAAKISRRMSTGSTISRKSTR